MVLYIYIYQNKNKSYQIGDCSFRFAMCKKEKHDRRVSSGTFLCATLTIVYKNKMVTNIVLLWFWFAKPRYKAKHS